MKRQTAVYYYRDNYYGVKYREKVFLFFWHSWRDVIDGARNDHYQIVVAWPKEEAYLRSDLAMKNGVVFTDDGNALPIWDRDEETEAAE